MLPNYGINVDHPNYGILSIKENEVDQIFTEVNTYMGSKGVKYNKYRKL